MADRVEQALRLSLKTAEAMVYSCGHPRGGCPNHCDLLVKVIHATRAALALPAEPPQRSQAQVVGWPTAKTWDDYENNAKATYGGGYRDEHEVNIFHHGMQTIFNLLRAEFPEAHECLALRSGASATPAPSEDE